MLPVLLLLSPSLCLSDGATGEWYWWELSQNVEVRRALIHSFASTDTDPAASLDPLRSLLLLLFSVLLLTTTRPSVPLSSMRTSRPCSRRACSIQVRAPSFYHALQSLLALLSRVSLR